MKAGPYTLKMTRQHRHGDLDRAILSTAREVLPASIAVHDMAASDGVTSLDLFNLLSEAIPEVRVRSSDYYDTLWAARRGPFHIFYDKDRTMMQVALGPFALRNRRANLLLARVLSPDMEALERISLLHPNVISKAKTDARFTVASESFFEPEQARYDIVRVMNALGERNFPRPQVERAVSAIAPTVADGGLLVLGRSADEIDGRSQATIFQRLGERFVGLCDLAGGYELKEFVLSI